jgi:hypothetical protein
MCLLNVLASLLGILDVLLLPQTVPIRGHAALARTFARCLSTSEAELFPSALARRGGI